MASSGNWATPYTCTPTSDTPFFPVFASLLAYGNLWQHSPFRSLPAHSLTAFAFCSLLAQSFLAPARPYVASLQQLRSGRHPRLPLSANGLSLDRQPGLRRLTPSAHPTRDQNIPPLARGACSYKRACLGTTPATPSGCGNLGKTTRNPG